MKQLFSLVLLAALAGCSPSDSGSGGAAVAAPRSATDIPANVQGTDRKAAESGIGAGQAATAAANDPARVHAMEEMKKQHGG